jgi:hypothetical protein
MTSQQQQQAGNVDQAVPPPVDTVPRAEAQAAINALQDQIDRHLSTIVRLESQSSAIRPPKPDTFDGRHCDTFIYSLEKLFSYYGESNSQRQVALAVTFLRGSALRWYKCAEQQDTARQLQSWPTFIAHLRAFFEASNTETLVRAKLANLKQMSSVAKYNDLYKSLVIEIVDLDARSKLDLYIRGLKSQVQLHVTLKEPKDLETAQRVALHVDSILVETGFIKPRDNMQNKNNPRRHNGRNNNRFGRSYQSSGGSAPMELGQAENELQQEQYENEDDSFVASAQTTYKGSNRLSAQEQQRLMKEGRCFICQESGHLARHCPQRGRDHPKND